MKRFLLMLGVMGIFITSCGTESGSLVENNVPETTCSVIEKTSESEKYYAANGKELKLNLGSYSENVKVLTEDDIYLKSVDCGYISGKKSYMLIIENREQLDTAFERYELGKQCDGTVSISFTEMVENYPVEDYTYVIQYVMTSSGIYDQRIGALVFDENNLNFVTTVDSKTPDRDQPQEEVMGGYCFYAAVPKGVLLNDHYERWVYPDANDMYQDKDYFYNVSYAAYETTELYDAYTDTEYDTQYVIRNEDEFRDFIDRSKDMKDSSGKPVFTFDPKVDFDNAVLVCEFFKCEYEQSHTFSHVKVNIEDDYVYMNYEKTDGSRIGFAYAVIPWKYIPETLSSYWEILEEEANTERPTYEIEKYSDIDTDYIEEGYIAVFHGGVGECTQQTYVYKDDEGFSYVNVESTTISWGSPIWSHKKKSRGSGKTREEIMKIAEKHGADSYVSFYDDITPHNIDEFMDTEF